MTCQRQTVFAASGKPAFARARGHACDMARGNGACSISGSQACPRGHKKLLFKAAPPENRLSIQQHGLRPGTWASYGEPGVYMYRSQLFAENWIGSEPMDVWEIDGRCLELFLDPEDPDAAVYTDEAVPVERLRLLGTFLEGEPYEPGQDELDEWGISA